MIPRKIVFVCTGNQCRSPMAEALMMTLLKDRCPDVQFTVTSCGCAGFVDCPATVEAIEVMKEQGIDLTYHMSHPISEQILQDADIIFVMSGRHREYIDTFYPQYSRKVHLLKEYALVGEGTPHIPHDDLDVPDPIGKRIEFYREVLSDLTFICNRIIEKWGIEEPKI
jgi:protein-tyrosine-phosphatase